MAKSGGPTRMLGTEAQATGRASGGSALAGYGHPPARTHALGPGTEKERGPTRGLGTEAQATAPSRPSTLASPPCSRELAGPQGTRHQPARTHALGPGTGKSGGGPSTLATPPRSRSRTPSHINIHRRLSQVPPLRHCLEIATAPAGFTRPGAQPSARRSPAACGGSELAGPRGARRPPARMHAAGPGTGKSGGRPSTLTIPPRSRSRTPSRIAFTTVSVRGPLLVTA